MREHRRGIVGAGGVLVPPEGYIEGVRSLCDKSLGESESPGTYSTTKLTGFEASSKYPQKMGRDRVKTGTCTILSPFSERTETPGGLFSPKEHAVWVILAGLYTNYTWFQHHLVDSPVKLRLLRGQNLSDREGFD